MNIMDLDHQGQPLSQNGVGNNTVTHLWDRFHGQLKTMSHNGKGMFMPANFPGVL